MKGILDTVVYGGADYNPGFGSGRLMAAGLFSGKKLVDTSYFGKVFAPGWTFSNGRLWAVHDDRKGLTEYALTGGPLKTVKVHLLDLSQVNFLASSAQYQALIVSTATNRVALLPRWIDTNNTVPVNEGYIWELSSGKLIHKISNFYYGAQVGPALPAYEKEKAAAEQRAFLAKLEAESAAKTAAGPCGEAKAQLKVKVGSWVRQDKAAHMVQLIDYDCNTQQYKAQSRFATATALNQTTYPVNLFEVSSTITNAKYKLVNAKTCQSCSGAGTISGKRNYEKVEYGIYLKYTTSGTTAFTDLCKVCKGDGVIGY